jgi:hypothetical protein
LYTRFLRFRQVMHALELGTPTILYGQMQGVECVSFGNKELRLGAEVCSIDTVISGDLQHM